MGVWLELGGRRWLVDEGAEDHKQLIRHGAVVVDEKPKAPARSRKAPAKPDPEGSSLGE